MELDFTKIELKCSVVVVAHLEPLESALRGLLVVDDPISGRSIAILGKLEVMAVQS